MLTMLTVSILSLLVCFQRASYQGPLAGPTARYITKQTPSLNPVSHLTIPFYE